MPQNHRASRSLQNPLQDNPLQQNPLQEISSLLEVCGEALDPPGGCWCLPTPAQLRPTELLCEVRSGTGAVVVVRPELTSDSVCPAHEDQLRGGDAGEDWRSAEHDGAGPPVPGALMGGALVGGASESPFWI